MSSVRIEITGDKSRLFKRLSSLSKLRKAEANQAIAEALRTSTVERFGTQMSPEGQRWKTSVRAQESGGKTLTKTTRLKNSIRSEAGPSGLAVGTNTIYAATHQLGASGRTIRPRRAKALRFKINGAWVTKKQVRINIPARPYLGMSTEDEEEISGIINDMMAEE